MECTTILVTVTECMLKCVTVAVSGLLLIADGICCVNKNRLEADYTDMSGIDNTTPKQNTRYPTGTGYV
jgi:hypothetical protein